MNISKRVMNIIIPLVVIFLNISPPLVGNIVREDSSFSVILVKQSWHTGIVLKVEEVISLIPQLSDFSEFEYVDIGWGDADFFQHPDFDALLAFRALFYSTPSVIRVKGFKYGVKRYIEFSDLAVLVEIDHNQLRILARYISEAFQKGKVGMPIELSSNNNRTVKFFAAHGGYHLFNTCNTWVAEGLKKAGVDIDPHIITAEQLFREVAVKGKVLKGDTQDCE